MKNITKNELKQIENSLLSIEDIFTNINILIERKQIKHPDFSDVTLRAAAFIFFNILLKKLYDKCEKQQFSNEVANKLAYEYGRKLNNLIYNATDIDIEQMYKNDNLDVNECIKIHRN